MRSNSHLNGIGIGNGIFTQLFFEVYKNIDSGL